MSFTASQEQQFNAVNKKSAQKPNLCFRALFLSSVFEGFDTGYFSKSSWHLYLRIYPPDCTFQMFGIKRTYLFKFAHSLYDRRDAEAL